MGEMMISFLLSMSGFVYVITLSQAWVCRGAKIGLFLQVGKFFGIN